MVSLEQENEVFTLYIPPSINPKTVDQILRSLNQVSAHEGPTSLIIASKHPKVFCGGMDFNYITTPEKTFLLIQKLFEVCKKIFEIGVPTIAALSGHAVAAGFVIAMCCDYRIMSRQAVVFMNQLELKLITPRGVFAILKSKTTPKVQRDLNFRVLRYSSQKCLVEKLVDQVCDKKETLAKSKELARQLAYLGKNKLVYSLIKKSTYKQTLQELKAPQKISNSEKQIMIKSFSPKL